MTERNDVALLADMACEIDYLRDKFLKPEWHDALTACVKTLHDVAQAASTEFGFEIYATDGDD
ncbi:hypothetical protein SKTS_33060 [Sulfurimicrobium lacus]|uniref:Uncharacterized protein n=1 Tax=Sulfurimicrobium lacus TaxID=2715678 RepID=A0A6F8VGE9_9PROT|nr:hypothetical protein [Sulfurimicrobium lacus]BCB28420.1 hypothetical protein SKTS_33060 [Sulfurimicrobium lacus]